MKIEIFNTQEEAIEFLEERIKEKGLNVDKDEIIKNLNDDNSPFVNKDVIMGFVTESLEENNFVISEFFNDTDVNKLEKTKSIKILEERVKNWEEKVEKLKQKISIHSRKSTFITCLKCSSKINLGYLKREFECCPICGQELRHYNNLAKLERYQQNLDTYKNELEYKYNRLKKNLCDFKYIVGVK